MHLIWLTNQWFALISRFLGGGLLHTRQYRQVPTAIAPTITQRNNQCRGNHRMRGTRNNTVADGVVKNHRCEQLEVCHVWRTPKIIPLPLGQRLDRFRSNSCFGLCLNMPMTILRATPVGQSQEIKVATAETGASCLFACARHCNFVGLLGRGACSLPWQRKHQGAHKTLDIGSHSGGKFPTTKDTLRIWPPSV